MFDIENSIIAFGTRGSAVCGEWGEAALFCCDIFGNVGGDWVGPIASQLGMSGNICADPQFADPAAEDFRLLGSSPCAPFTPPNPECDLIGAWPVASSSSVPEPPATPVTWGPIKGMFRGGPVDVRPGSVLRYSPGPTNRSLRFVLALPASSLRK